MNIREFAKLCGVAHSTVSRVLNLSLEQSHVSRKTYDRIRAKAVEVGFHVNYYAQAFHSKTSNCLGFIASNRLPMLLKPLLYGISALWTCKERICPCICATMRGKLKLLSTRCCLTMPTRFSIFLRSRRERVIRPGTWMGSGKNIRISLR